MILPQMFAAAPVYRPGLIPPRGTRTRINAAHVLQLIGSGGRTPNFDRVAIGQVWHHAVAQAD